MTSFVATDAILLCCLIDLLTSKTIGAIIVWCSISRSSFAAIVAIARPCGTSVVRVARWKVPTLIKKDVARRRPPLGLTSKVC